MQETFIVGADVLKATINYLQTQPYQNVARLIAALQQSEPQAAMKPEVKIEEAKAEYETNG